MGSDEAPFSTVRREDSPRASGEAPRKPHLFLVMECGRPLAGGARCALDGIDEVHFARTPSRQISREGRKLVVGVPDTMMSSSHARLVRAGGWAIQDLGSTNGTLVDALRVEKTAPVDDGALVELGATLFAVRWLPTQPQTPKDVEVAPGPDASYGMATLLPTYADAIASLRRVMATQLSVVLLGETGTGKELLARATHERSARRGGFVAVNCGAIPAMLVESQLFGHTRGAFSGAVRDELGLVRTSDGGTLFLDEIGDLPAASQAALLRVLQEGEVHSLGTARPVKVDLRVVSATHRRIDALSSSGFRSDLYARVAGYVHELPPLRERREDLGIVVGTLLRDLAPDRADRLVLAPELGRALYAHSWARNVRELRHVLAGALVFADRGKIDLAHVPAEVRDAAACSEPRPAEPSEPITEAERALRTSLVEQLTIQRGNVSEVARAMGKTRMQIHRWMRRFGVDPNDYRKG